MLGAPDIVASLDLMKEVARQARVFQWSQEFPNAGLAGGRASSAGLDRTPRTRHICGYEGRCGHSRQGRDCQMPSVSEWKIPASVQPKPEDYSYELDHALAAMVGLHAIVPQDAFTAETLGTERAGNGVFIRDNGLVLTIGYLITEAETIWLSLSDGRSVQGHVLGYDQETGFGLVQALAKLEMPTLEFGQSAAASIGERVVVAGAGGRARSAAARIVAKQEFAGYWEYVLDEAIFTAPAHPNWGGTALIGPAGELLGIGSLQLQHVVEKGQTQNINMIVPIDLLKPIFDDLMKSGRRPGPPRPWLGLYATEVEGRLVVLGLADRGPARKADLRQGDILLSVGGKEVRDLAGFFRRIWAQGSAGVEVPLTIYRDGETMNVRVKSSERNRFLKGPSLH
jgi:S1-C subfamily serine protease